MKLVLIGTLLSHGEIIHFKEAYHVDIIATNVGR